MSLFKDSSGTVYDSAVDDVRQDFNGNWVYLPPSMGGDDTTQPVYVSPLTPPASDITQPDSPQPPGPYGSPDGPWAGRIVGFWNWEQVGLDDYRANRNGYAWVEHDTDTAYVAWYNAAHPPISGGFSLGAFLESVGVGMLLGAGAGGMTTATAAGNVATNRDIADNLAGGVVLDASGALIVGGSLVAGGDVVGASVSGSETAPAFAPESAVGTDAAPFDASLVSEPPPEAEFDPSLISEPPSAEPLTTQTAASVPAAGAGTGSTAIDMAAITAAAQKAQAFIKQLKGQPAAPAPSAPAPGGAGAPAGLQVDYAPALKALLVPGLILLGARLLL